MFETFHRRFMCILEYTPQLELSILKDFLQILDFNKAYIVLPILATEATTGSGPILSLI